jgi:hypothetical protein
MAKNFSKFLGKVALMTAAALWAGCGDSEKKTEEPVTLNSVKIVQPQIADVSQSQILEKAAPSAKDSATAETLASENEAAESSASDSVVVTEQPKDSLLKRAARVAKVKSEIGMIRALYGVVEEDMGRAVALYGVRPPREIIMPDGPREIHQPKPVARCFVKELTEKDVVVGEGSDIGVQTLLKVFRQRSPGIRHICNKNLYTNLKYRAKRTKEFEGTIVFEMKIAPSGKVENVEIKSSMARFNKEMKFAPSGKVENVEIKSSTVPFSEEIKKSITRWVFSKTQNGGTFTFPVNLYEVIPSAATSASEQLLSPTEN